MVRRAEEPGHRRGYFRSSRYTVLYRVVWVIILIVSNSKNCHLYYLWPGTG
jgi:hypothetical protein